MIENGYEIDFIPVDSGQRNGDAISIRVRENKQDTIYVIDGGTLASGQLVIDHINKYYETNKVDYLINTHPDNDHISGLTVIAEKMQIGEIWMHLPWNHSEDVIEFINDGRVTENSLSRRLQDSLKMAKKLEEIADEKGIPIKEPFQGKSIGHFRVLSPSEDWYIQLISNFKNMPESTDNKTLGGNFNKLKEMVGNKFEDWNIETLSENGETSAENESSAILCCSLTNGKFLLTGDAGINALEKAYDYSISKAINLKECIFYQVPHHGSRRNLTPSILNKILGPKLKNKGIKARYAYVNVSNENNTHPKKCVSNAFLRRGVEIGTTKGKTICYPNGFPNRLGWSVLQTLPFYNEVED